MLIWTPNERDSLTCWHKIIQDGWHDNKIDTQVNQSSKVDMKKNIN